MWEDNNRSRTELIGWLRRSLGEGVVAVELTDEQVEDAITEAEEYFQMWIGIVKSVDFTTTNDSVIPKDAIGDDVDSVVDIIFETRSGTYDQFFGWADVEFHPLQSHYSGQNLGGYSTLFQHMQYMEDIQRLLSSDEDWDWDRVRGELILSPSNISSGRKIRIFYLSRNMDYSKLQTYEWRLFKEYTLAKGMKKLSMPRTKYSDKPSATGSFAMDGDILWANAEAIESSVEEKIGKMQRPIGFFAG